MNNEFEMGPIRPPSEATSILVRVTRNCPWNKCAFCHTYQDQTFSRRTVEEVKQDIDSIYTITARILDVLGSNGNGQMFTMETLQKARGDDRTPEYYYKQVAFWMQYGMRTAFLQDANSMLLPTAQLVDIITHLKKRFPSIERITTYSRSKTMSRKTIDELKDLRAAGLTRLHTGMESGCDEVLDFIRKGVTSEEQITGGKKIVEAGFDLSEYYMPGIGGKKWWKENALESARVLSSINPTYIRLRSTVPVPGTPLFDAMERGEWEPLGEVEKVREIRLFIENLDGITSIVKSDHIMNLIEDIEGTLPGDKNSMLDVIDRFLAMDEDNREMFIIGRRLGQYRSLAEYRPNQEIENVRRQLKSRFATLDEAIMEILRNYI
ncbi:MAG TPA: radical SAM protein [Spirochaetota bacterium]|nr:radical SAM protein [Spirochaetota bacterium]HPQ52249.1 radical SAM protein [Spirochaetota bacterium]